MVETIKSTYDFIKGALPIRVGILANDNAENICLKNNLSFSDLIKPFSILTNEAQIQGPSSQTYRLYNLHVHAIDVKNAAPESATSSLEDGVAAQINDMSPTEKSSAVTIQAGDYNLSVNRTCPWMELYRNFVLRSGPVQTHEYIGHLVACMLVVSSSDPDPLRAFSDISQQQNRIQHGDTDNPLRWMTPNTMKFYVLIHDVRDGDITKAKEVFSSLQSMYGQTCVYLLQINSRECSTNDSGADVPAPWRQMKNMSKIDVTPSIATISNGTDTTAPSSAILGCCLDIEDHSALRNFMQDFILRALLPHLEKTIRNINEQLSTRKGLHKSLFKATKAIFGSSKSSSPASSGGYHTDSNELLVRKAADLCFLSQMYDQALHLYHGAKKDYMNDQAWLHAAGASEMAAIANFMMRNSKQSYPIQYMEYAINSYLDICKREQLALRCSLIHVECLQQVGMFQEAAFHFVRMTTEKNDLRSALLLEQAAYCYLKMQNPQPKKFAFQMVLAGHRFGKCGQKSHAIRCYEMAAQMYSDKQWQVIHDHLDYAVGRLYSSSKNFASAMNYFRKLLIGHSSLPDVQQVFILREFGNVWHKSLALGNVGKFANLLLPRLELEETSVIVVSLDTDIVKRKNTDNSKIRELEDHFLDKKMMPRKRFIGAITSLSKDTDNAIGHQISVGESVSIEIVCVNHLGIPIVLHDVIVEFTREYLQDCSGSGNEPSHKCRPIEHVTLDANDKSILIFKFEPIVPGKFSAKSISYKLGCQSAGGSSFDDSDRTLQVIDCQPLVIKGKRLNSSREEKFGIFYATDNRLNVQSYVGFPEFKAEFQDFPISLVCDEVREIILVVTNVGKYPISSLEFAVTGDVMITPKGTKKESQSDRPKLYSLTNDTLDPDQTGKYSLHLKGPMKSGQYTSNIMVFCKSDELSSPLYRSYLLQHQLSCCDGINIEIEMINAMNESNNVISVCAESIGQDTNDFSFKDLTLEMGSKVNPVGSEKSSTVPISTKLYKYFKLEGNNIASSLLDGEQLEASVEWNYTDKMQSSQVNGYQMINVKSTGSLTNSTSDKENISNAETLKYLHHTISWRLSVDNVYHHNFSLGQPCVIACKLIAVNISKLKLCVSISATGPTITSLGTNRASGFSWVGITKVNRIIEPKGKSIVLLKACFTKPGIYSLGGVIVSATPVNLTVDAPIPQKPLSSYFVTIDDTGSISE